MMNGSAKVGYVVWGKLPGKTVETALYTRAATKAEAYLAVRTLRDMRGARAMRVQVIDLRKII